MRRYGSYLEDASKSIPKSSRYRKGLDYESSSEESHENVNCELHDSDEDNGNGNNTLSNQDMHGSATESRETSNVADVSCATPNESMMDVEVPFQSHQSTSSTSQQIPDATISDVHDEMFGLQSSEDDSFHHSWIREAQQELFEDSDNDDFSSGINENDISFNALILEEPAEEEFSFKKLKDMLAKDENNETLNANVVVSKAEMLLAVLKLGLTYNLSQAAIADIFKMINCFFGSAILPETRYLIDQIFNSKTGIEYHAVCSNCKRYISRFDREEQRIVCNLCGTEIFLKNPMYNEYFATVNFNNDIIHLLQENAAHYDTVVNRRRENREEFNDIISGEMYTKLFDSLHPDQKTDFITTTFNSDGSPVFESSKCSVWPIQMVINELPFHIRTANPIVCALWFGKDKPDMNIFLNPFIEKLKDLSSNGLKCKINDEERIIRVFPVCCCVDSVARAPMQGITQFNGHFGCSWCLHPGIYIRHNRGGSIKYVLLDEAVSQRTQMQTLQHMQESLISPNPVYGVKKPSSLINLPRFDLVRGFVPCSMHCVSLGIAEQFVSYWVNSSNMPYSLSNDEIKRIDDILSNIKAPNQIARLSRPFKDRKWWKAREWENWTLFYSIPILLCFPRMEQYLNHWRRLVEAFYILLQESINRTEINHANDLLNEFIVLTEILYGKWAMTYNVHQLQHLAQSVADWGPLWAHSGYCFESGNGRIVEQIHSAKGVVHQLCRSIAMSQSELILKDHIALKDSSTIMDFVSYLEKKKAKSTFKLLHARYFGGNRRTKAAFIRELQLSEESRTFHKMVKDKCLYTSCRNKRIRSDNSIAITNDGRIIRLIEFILDPATRKEFTSYNLVNTDNIFDNENFFIKKVTSISNNVNTLDTNEINKICVFIQTDNAMYICTVPNLYSY